MIASRPSLRLTYHHALASRPLGRWWLNCCVRAKRLAWRWLVAGDATARRILDLSGAILFLLVFSPLYLAIAFAIKVEDGGPVFFIQTRVGRHGRVFRMLKFRSMCLDAEQRLAELLARNHHADGVTFKLREDPRITRTGRWLRRFSLDELPQFFNVLAGDMSLVGPRPPVPREVALYSLADRRRLAVKPGLTCLWQIGGRATIDFSGQVRLDVAYIEHQSLATDLAILLRTPLAVISGRGAY